MADIVVQAHIDNLMTSADQAEARAAIGAASQADLEETSFTTVASPTELPSDPEDAPIGSVYLALDAESYMTWPWMEAPWPRGWYVRVDDEEEDTDWQWMGNWWGAGSAEAMSAIIGAFNAGVPLVSETDAEAGTVTDIRQWSPLRVKEAIEALVSWSNITGKPSTFPPTIGSGADQAVAGNDARLTDERVPTAAGLTSKFGTNKATLIDGDKVAILDSAASDAPKHGLWSLVKSTLKTYFDTLYLALVAPGTSGNVLTSNGSAWTSAAPSGGGGGRDIFDFGIYEIEAYWGGASGTGNFPMRSGAIGSGQTLTASGSSDFPNAEIRTGANSGAGYSIQLLAPSWTAAIFDLDGTHVWRCQWLVRTGASVADIRAFVGVLNTGGTVTPADGIFVRCDTSLGDSSWELAAYSASSATLASASLGAIAANTTYTINIWSTGDGSVRATVNGGTERTLSSGLSTERMMPSIIFCTATTADKRLQYGRLSFRVDSVSP